MEVRLRRKLNRDVTSAGVEQSSRTLHQEAFSVKPSRIDPINSMLNMNLNLYSDTDSASTL